MRNLLPNGSTRVIVFVDAPHDGFVKPVTRFWNASESTSGSAPMALNVQTESWRRCSLVELPSDDDRPQRPRWRPAYR